MKKILLSIACLLMIGYSVDAQPWGFGPKVGSSFSTVNGLPSAKVRMGLTAGMFAERFITNNFAMQVELMWSQQGFDIEAIDEDPKVEYNLDYLTMPVIGKYYLMGGLNMQLGAQFSYLLGAKQKIGDGEKTSERKLFNNYNAAFVAGLAYDFNCGLIIEGRYNLGLTRVLSGVADVTSGYLTLTAGWRF